MAWSASADTSEFSEAVAYFRDLVPMTQDEYDALEDAARSRAFHIAAHLELHAVQTIYDEIGKAIADGAPIDAFEKTVAEKLDGKLGIDGHLLETVFINANQQSYNVGRWEQMNDPAMNALRPFRMFDAVLDSRTTPHCEAWDGVIRAWDDPCWQNHSPQCHHRCRSSLRSLRPAEAAERGITQDLPGEQASDGFGLAPSMRTGDVPQPNRESFDSDAWAMFEARLAQARADLSEEQRAIDQERAKREQ